MLLCTLGCMYLFNLSVFVFSSYVPRSGIAGSYGSSIFSFSFPHWLHQFTFPPAVYKGSLSFTSLPTFVVLSSMLAILFFLNLYWSIIASQYCAIFCCTTKQISHMHTYVPISPPSWASLPSSLAPPSRSLQSTELIFLCYAAASH